MLKRVVSKILAAALVVTSISFSASSAAAATKEPKAAYTFNFNKANKKVVAVARPGDKGMLSKTGMVDGRKEHLPVLPTEKTAKNKKIKVQYTKNGKHGKGLNLTQKQKKYGYGVQLKGVKLGSGSWSVAFWVKATAAVSNYVPIFFTQNSVAKNTERWLSITKSSWLGDASPTIWSTNNKIKNLKGEFAFPWFVYDEQGKFRGKSDTIKKGKWVHIVLVCNSKDRKAVYNEGNDGEYKGGYHGWTYVNGILYGNGSIAKDSVTNKNTFYLGINAWNCPFKGVIDDVKFYKKALSAKQVKAVYKSKK